MNQFNTKYFITLVIIFCLGTGCATRSEFVSSDIVPAARGVVKVKEDKNDNHVIDVTVKHLAEPARLDPPKRFYIVWIETAKGEIINIGQLHTSAGLNASLTTVTPYKPERLFITGEEQGNLRQPYSSVVLSVTL